MINKMNLNDLQNQARQIWGDQKMSEQEIAIASGVTYGDICRYIRDKSEGGEVNERELKKELGNVLFSMTRWVDDLGYSLEECVDLAKTSQEQYNGKA